jgi:NAD(P)-dependent dehydrogenase (short-subunit alcohol dehydrogenase family)
LFAERLEEKIGDMDLSGKNAVIYGAGGSLGGAVAKAFAAAGARVFLTGRNLEPVQRTTDDINRAGGLAEAAKVDGFEEQEITGHLDAVIQAAGTLDISFNFVGVDVVQNRPMTEIATDDFMRPVTFMLHTRFVTAMAAARIMMKQRSGVILSLTATPGGIGYPYTGGFAPACSAIEAFSRNLAAELGIYGIRVVNIRSGGSPDSAVFRDAIENHPEAMKTILKQMEGDTMLKTLPLMEDIANAAVFAASDKAGKISGVTIDLTCGTTAGLNYRVVIPTIS